MVHNGFGRGTSMHSEPREGANRKLAPELSYHGVKVYEVTAPGTTRCEFFVTGQPLYNGVPLTARGGAPVSKWWSVGTFDHAGRNRYCCPGVGQRFGQPAALTRKETVERVFKTIRNIARKNGWGRWENEYLTRNPRHKTEYNF